MMDCATTRGHFSSRLDRRLAADTESDISLHLVACDPCARTWQSYSTLYGALSEFESSESPRPFVRPAEAPGRRSTRTEGTSRGSHRRLVFSRKQSWIAAALLLIASHLAVFTLGSSGAPAKVTTDHPGPSLVAEAAPAPAPEALRATAVSTPVRQRIRDHLDAAELMAREIAYMPADAGPLGLELVASQAQVLDSTELLLTVERSTADLGDSGPIAQRALQRFRGLSLRILDDLPRLRNSPQAVAELQGWLEESALSQALEAASPGLANEARGVAFREGSWDSRLATVASTAAPEVRQFLDAKWSLLRGRYDEARQSFRTLRLRAPASRVYPLLVYMEAESAWRRGDTAGAFDLLRDFDPRVVRSNASIVFRDPMVAGSLGRLLPEMQRHNGSLVLQFHKTAANSSRILIKITEENGEGIHILKVQDIPGFIMNDPAQLLSERFLPVLLSEPLR